MGKLFSPYTDRTSGLLLFEIFHFRFSVDFVASFGPGSQEKLKAATDKYLKLADENAALLARQASLYDELQASSDQNSDLKVLPPCQRKCVGHTHAQTHLRRLITHSGK